MSELLTRAKQGDRQAIAALINKSLQPKGITAKISINQPCLQIALESAKLVNQAVIVAYLQKGVEGLHPPGIETLRVFHRRIGVANVDWVAQAVLAATNPTQIKPAEKEQSSAIAEPAKPQGISTTALAAIAGGVALFSVLALPLLVVAGGVASGLTYRAAKNGVKREAAIRTWSTSFLWSWGACFAVAAAIAAVIAMNKPSTQTGDRSEPTNQLPSTASSSMIFYLAVRTTLPSESVPTEVVPVGDRATIEAMTQAGKAGDRATFNQLAQSAGVHLMPGGTTVTVVSNDGTLSQVTVHGRDQSGVDVSGQTFWVPLAFVQSRAI